jgi:hypothetical protein
MSSIINVQELPLVKEIREQYKAKKNYDDIKKNNLSKKELEIVQRNYKKENIKIWLPISASIVIMSSFLVYNGYYTEKNELLNEIGREFTERISKISPENIADEQKILNMKYKEFEEELFFGQSILGVTKGVLGEAYEKINLGTFLYGLGLYSTLKTGISFLNNPIKRSIEDNIFNRNQKTEKDTIDFFKKVVGNESLNKFNNFELFDMALNLNKNLNEIQENPENFLERGLNSAIYNIKKKLFKEKNKLEEMETFIYSIRKEDNFKETIKKMSKEISEEDLEAFFSSTNRKDRRKEISDLINDSIQFTHYKKLEEELILRSFLILSSEGKEKENKKLEKKLIEDINILKANNLNGKIDKEKLKKLEKILNGKNNEKNEKTKEKILNLIPNVIIKGEKKSLGHYECIVRTSEFDSLQKEILLNIEKKITNNLNEKRVSMNAEIEDEKIMEDFVEKLSKRKPLNKFKLATEENKRYVTIEAINKKFNPSNKKIKSLKGRKP